MSKRTDEDFDIITSDTTDKVLIIGMSVMATVVLTTAVICATILRIKGLMW